MKKLFTCVVLASALALVGTACDKTETTETASATAPTDVSVDELSSLIDKGGVKVCDVNGEETRKEQGVIPGAVLLSGSSDYDLGKLGDKNQELVFYCGSEKCASAPKAAERAMGEGYKNVKVLRAGIKGWKAAGKKTDEFKG